MDGVKEDVQGDVKPRERSEASVNSCPYIAVSPAAVSGALSPQRAPSFPPAFVQGHLKRSQAVALQANIGRRRSQRLALQSQASPGALNGSKNLEKACD